MRRREWWVFFIVFYFSGVSRRGMVGFGGRISKADRGLTQP